MQQQKFVTFVVDNDRPIVVLGIVDYHKHIKVPNLFKDATSIYRCGGGRWRIYNDKLYLSDLSGDFGKYDFDYTKEAFDNNDVYIVDSEGGYTKTVVSNIEMV